MEKDTCLEKRKYTPEEVSYVRSNIPDIRFDEIPVGLINFWLKHKENKAKNEKLVSHGRL